MRALLLYPEFPETFWSFRHALKFIRKRAAMPPLGLLTIAAMLPEDWSLRLIDLNVRKLRARDLEAADIVLISAMLAQREAAESLIARCRAAGKIVVAGGPLFSSEPDSFPEVDHLVLDEAERTLAPFLRDLECGRARHVYRAQEFADMATSPIPRWELAELDRYASMSVQYSRGCPFNCEFCNVITLFGRKPRVKSGAQLVAELEALRQAGWHGSVFFADDNLIGSRGRLRRDLLPALAAWRQRHGGFPLLTEASIDLADDPELLQGMVDAGFGTVFIGIETPDAVALAECNKRQNGGRDLVADVKAIQRAGLEVQGGFIVGFDSDNTSIFDRQIEFIQRSGIVTAMVGLLNALPGTRLYARLAEEGRILDSGGGDNCSSRLNFIPRMDHRALIEGHRRVLRTIYAPGPYAKRVRTFLREFRPSPQLRPWRIRWSDLHAMLHSAFRLGLIGRGRFHFWGLLIWTGVRRPSLFPLAVRLAIYGHHFRKMALGASG